MTTQALNTKISLQDFSKGITKMLSNPTQKIPKYLEFLLKSKKEQFENGTGPGNSKNGKPILNEQYKQFLSNVPATFSFNSPTQKQTTNHNSNDQLLLTNKEKNQNQDLKHEKRIAHQTNKSSSNYQNIVNQSDNRMNLSKEKKRKKKNSAALSLDTADFQVLKNYFQYQENSIKKDSRPQTMKKDSDSKKPQRTKQEKYRIAESKPIHKKKQSEDLLNCQKKSTALLDSSEQKSTTAQEKRKKQLTIHDFNNIVKKELSQKDYNLKTLNINLFEKNCVTRKAIDLTQSTKASMASGKPNQFLSMTASSVKQPGKRQQQQYTFTKNSNLKLNNFVEVAKEQSELSIKTSVNKNSLKQATQLTDTNISSGLKKFNFQRESLTSNSKKKDNSIHAKNKVNNNKNNLNNNNTEYEKLQDRLTDLESKILTVQTNLESNNQQNNKKQLFQNQLQPKTTTAAQPLLVSLPKQNEKKIVEIQYDEKKISNTNQNNEKNNNNNLINLFKKINSNMNKQSQTRMSVESKDLQQIKLQNEKLTQYLNKIKNQQEAKKKQFNKESKEYPEQKQKSNEIYHTRNRTAQIELKSNNNQEQEGPSIQSLVTQVKLGQQFPQFSANTCQPQTCSPPSPEQPQPISGNYSDEFIFGFQELYYVGKLIESFLLDIDDYFVLMFRDHFLQSLQTLHFLQCLEPKNNSTIEDKMVTLGKKDPSYYFTIDKYQLIEKKTLILDLDETLIHCNESLEFPSDIIIPIQFPTGEKLQVGVNIRPYTREFLKELNNYFEIIIFTASHSCYANKVLDILDPKNNLIKHRLFRENCVLTPDGFFVKDLDIFQDRDINEMIIVDNAVYSFAYHLANGIPILPFYDNPDDTELNDLATYLIKLVAQDEISKINSLVFKLNEYHKFMNPVQLLETLYSCFLEDDDEETK